MTPDQLDRLQLTITNMVLVDDGEEPITMAQLQQDAADNPAEFAKVRERVQRVAAAVHEVFVEAVDLPALPVSWGFLHLHYTSGISQVLGYSPTQMHDYARQALRHARY